MTVTALKMCNADIRDVVVVVLLLLRHGEDGAFPLRT